MRPISQMRRPNRKRKGSEVGTMPRLVKDAAAKANVPDKVARAVVDGFLAAVKAATWKLGRVCVPDFAVFQVRHRAERAVETLVHGERLRFQLKATDAVAVRAAKTWRQR